MLVLAGALGNAIDRLIYGYVVDMFQFVFLKHFAIFNVADIFITCGTILFCIVIFREDSETIPATVGTIKQKVTSAVFTLHNKLPFKSAEHITTVAEEMELPVIDDMALDSVAEEVTAVFDAISTETITAIENIVNPTEESHLEDTGVFKPIPEENPFIPFLEEKTTKLSIEETTKFLIKESPAEMSDSVRSPVEAEPLAKEALSAEATSSAFVEPEAETHTAELPEESASDSETRLSKTSSEPEPDKVSASDDAIPFEPAVSMFDDAFHLLSDNDDDETFTLTDILAEFSDKDYEN